MSLATRCTSCRTVFKVVQDQLKVSKGWVRCGRCNTVFNALEELFELPPDAIVGNGSGSEDTFSHTQMPQPEPEDNAYTENADASAQHHDDFADDFYDPTRRGKQQTPAELVEERDRNEFADAQFHPDLLPDGIEDEALAGALSARDPDHYSPPLPGDETPAFVRHADRQARWKSPLARWLLSLSALLLTGILTLQIGHHFRDRLAAEFPAHQGLFLQWCEFWNCRIEAYRSIKDITVETTALTRMPNSQDEFRLSVTLRNRGHLNLLLPAIDLNVTDVNGQMIARRALSTQDFRVQDKLLKPNAELALQLVLKAENPRVNGYTVEIFYP